MNLSLAAPQETLLTHCSPLSPAKCHSSPIAVPSLCHTVLGLLNRAIIWLSNKEKTCKLHREGSSLGIKRPASCAAASEATDFTQVFPHFYTSGNSVTTASQLCCRFPRTHTHMHTHASSPDSVTTACISPIPKKSFLSLFQQCRTAFHSLSSCTSITAPWFIPFTHLNPCPVSHWHPLFPLAMHLSAGFQYSFHYSSSIYFMFLIMQVVFLGSSCTWVLQEISCCHNLKLLS